MSHHKIFGLSLFACVILASQTSYAGFIFSFDTTQLEVQATGGIVTQQVDLRIRHEAPGQNTISSYQLNISPSVSALTVITGPVTVSDFSFNLGHLVVGSGSYSISGNNLVDLNVSTGSENLLARMVFQIDTATFSDGEIDLNLSLAAARRGGLIPGSSSILDEVTLVPASFNVTAVPEPTSLVLVAASSAGLFWRFRRGKGSFGIDRT